MARLTGSRARGVSLGALVVGAALVLLAGGQVWFRGRAIEPGLPALPLRVTGRGAAATISAVGLLALAAAAVALFVGPRVRRVVAVVVGLVALDTTVQVVRAVADQDSAVRPAVRDLLGQVTTSAATSIDMTAWPWVALAGVLVVLAGAVVMLVTAPSWPARARRYEREDAEPASGDRPARDLPADESDDAMWKALDRGEDPTD